MNSATQMFKILSIFRDLLDRRDKMEPKVFKLIYLRNVTVQYSKLVTLLNYFKLGPTGKQGPAGIAGRQGDKGPQG